MKKYSHSPLMNIIKIFEISRTLNQTCNSLIALFAPRRANSSSKRPNTSIKYLCLLPRFSGKIKFPISSICVNINHQRVTYISFSFVSVKSMHVFSGSSGTSSNFRSLLGYTSWKVGSLFSSNLPKAHIT